MWGQGHTCVFPEDAEHLVWVPSWFVKPHGPPGPKDEEAETGRHALGQETTEADSSTHQPPVRQTWNCKPPTWGQIKNMTTMVTGNLGMTGNPTATLQAALVIITIQMGVVQGDALDFHAQPANGTSYHLAESS
jgi:hypothetical protein